jgi:hypothetical protein
MGVKVWSKDKAIANWSAAALAIRVRRGQKHSLKEYTECRKMSGRFAFSALPTLPISE